MSIWRFIAAELVLTLGVALALCFKDSGWVLGYMLIGSSGHCLPSKRSEALYRLLKWNDAICIVGILLAVAVLIFAAVRFVPGESVVRWMRHPGVLTALWVINTGLHYRLWSRANRPTDATELSQHPLP